MRAEQADTQVEHVGQRAALAHGLDQARVLATRAAVLAYLFWHRPRDPEARRGLRAGAARASTARWRTAARAGCAARRASACRLPWLTPRHHRRRSRRAGARRTHAVESAPPSRAEPRRGAGYEDWYLVEDCAALGVLKEAAVARGHRTAHDEVARAVRRRRRRGLYGLSRASAASRSAAASWPSGWRVRRGPSAVRWASCSATAWTRAASLWRRCWCSARRQSSACWRREAPGGRRQDRGCRLVGARHVSPARCSGMVDVPDRRGARAAASSSARRATSATGSGRDPRTRRRRASYPVAGRAATTCTSRSPAPGATAWRSCASSPGLAAGARRSPTWRRFATSAAGRSRGERFS